MEQQINIARDILEKNDQLADELRLLFTSKGILTLNLMSSPGAGKTTLLEKTLAELKDKYKMAVIEGDVQTNNDARRIASTGVKAVQINTDGGCHLDSAMIQKVLNEIDLDDLDILFVENVGNLVCPAEFTVGEDHKITILSVPEGDDKPEKYPLMFAESSVVLLNKTDLLPYVEFSLDRAANFSRSLKNDVKVFPVSAKTEEGLADWFAWLDEQVEAKRG
ncbi:MAG: hydrogenase nickel incorporation protein HypB [Thermodesulfobacteriota bacterium]